MNAIRNVVFVNIGFLLLLITPIVEASFDDSYMNKKW